jgi:hypothetical protein
VGDYDPATRELRRNTKKIPKNIDQALSPEFVKEWGS